MEREGCLWRADPPTLAIEYIQDYCDLAGLKMWQAELARITGYFTEQESNRYLQKKIYDGQSRYQSRAIPIPRFEPVDQANNFMGRTGEGVPRQAKDELSPVLTS